MKKKIIFFLVFCFIGGFLFYLHATKIKNCFIFSKKDTLPQITSIPQKKIDHTRDFLKLEYLLITKNIFDNKPISYLFGVKINSFHPDWVCDNSYFSDSGYEVSCYQKPCQYLIKNKVFNPKAILPPECYDELKKREYSPGFYQIGFKAKKKIFEAGVTPSLINPINKTMKGIAYFLIVEKKDKYKINYKAVFYSPTKLSDSHLTGAESQSGLTSWGEYQLETTIADTSDNDKVIGLFEKIIDSIEFIKLKND